MRTSQTGEAIETYDVTADHSHAMIKLTDDGCLVSVDLDHYYGKKRKEIGEIVFTDKLEKEDRIWIPNSYNVVWPRKAFPPKLASGDGPGRWLELVACTLLEDTDDDRKFLDAYIALRLQERMEKALNPPKPTGGVRHRL